MYTYLVIFLIVIIFVFKQKTAYEMRISDWSSDVCSSDLLFLGEVVRMRRWSAVVAGFIGVLVIVRPGSDAFTAGSLVALMAAGLTGAVTISIKSLTGSEPADRIVLLTTLLWVPLSLPAALAVWQWQIGRAHV